MSSRKSKPRASKSRKTFKSSRMRIPTGKTANYNKTGNKLEFGSRPALGREVSLLGQNGLPQWLIGVLDAISRHHSDKSAIVKTWESIARSRRLGSKERKKGAEALFSWARGYQSAEKKVADLVKEIGGISPSKRDQNLACLALCSPLDLKFLYHLPDNFILFIQSNGAKVEIELPQWLNDEINQQDNPSELRAALLESAPVFLAFDPQNTSKETLIAAFSDLNIKAESSPFLKNCIKVEKRFAKHRLPATLREEFWPMDLGSQVISELSLPNNTDDLVLDLCAGGGGKAKYISSRNHIVLAGDTSFRRLQAAQKRNIKNAFFIWSDGSNAPYKKESFQRILIDAPCSGSGTLRRKPDALSQLKAEDLTRYQQAQKDLLKSAVPLLAKDGILIYATCSLLKSENEDQIQWALDNLNVEAVPFSQFSEIAQAFEMQNTEYQLRMRPDKHQSDAFFVAALKAR